MLPRFSIVLETANLSIADLDNLRATLESFASQTCSVEHANEVLIADSGDVPDDVLQEALRAFPWARAMRLPAGTGYEELKMAGAGASTGDVIVFADGDCRYDPRWLELMLAPFRDPSVQIVSGVTAIDPRGPYGFAAMVTYSFLAPSRKAGLYVVDRYHLNNVAFRREVLEAVPIPSRRPCYRMSGLHSAHLRAAGYTIYRQAEARATHAAPNGLSHFIWRNLLFGHDVIVVPRLIAQDLSARPKGGATVRHRGPAGLIGLAVSQAFAKVASELRQRPARVFSLPVVVPIVLGAYAIQALGALAAVIAPARLLAAAPEEVISSATTERQGV